MESPEPLGRKLSFAAQRAPVYVVAVQHISGPDHAMVTVIRPLGMPVTCCVDDKPAKPAEQQSFAMRLSRFSFVLAALVLLTGCNFKAVPEPQVSARDTEYMALIPAAQEDLRYGRYLMDDPTG